MNPNSTKTQPESNSHSDSHFRNGCCQFFDTNSELFLFVTFVPAVDIPVIRGDVLPSQVFESVGFKLRSDCFNLISLKSGWSIDSQLLLPFHALNHSLAETFRVLTHTAHHKFNCFYHGCEYHITLGVLILFFNSFWFFSPATIAAFFYLLKNKL